MSTSSANLAILGKNTSFNVDICSKSPKTLNRASKSLWAFYEHRVSACFYSLLSSLPLSPANWNTLLRLKWCLSILSSCSSSCSCARTFVFSYFITKSSNTCYDMLYCSYYSPNFSFISSSSFKNNAKDGVSFSSFSLKRLNSLTYTFSKVWIFTVLAMPCIYLIWSLSWLMSSVFTLSLVFILSSRPITDFEIWFKSDSFLLIFLPCKEDWSMSSLWSIYYFVTYLPWIYKSSYMFLTTYDKIFIFSCYGLVLNSSLKKSSLSIIEKLSILLADSLLFKVSWFSLPSVLTIDDFWIDFCWFKPYLSALSIGSISKFINSAILFFILPFIYLLVSFFFDLTS